MLFQLFRTKHFVLGDPFPVKRSPFSSQLPSTSGPLPEGKRFPFWWPVGDWRSEPPALRRSQWQEGKRFGLMALFLPKRFGWERWFLVPGRGGNKPKRFVVLPPPKMKRLLLVSSFYWLPLARIPEALRPGAMASNGRAGIEVGRSLQWSGGCKPALLPAGGLKKRGTGVMLTKGSASVGNAGF